MICRRGWASSLRLFISARPLIELVTSSMQPSWYLLECLGQGRCLWGCRSRRRASISKSLPGMYRLADRAADTDTASFVTFCFFPDCRVWDAVKVLDLYGFQPGLHVEFGLPDEAFRVRLPSCGRRRRSAGCARESSRRIVRETWHAQCLALTA